MGTDQDFQRWLHEKQLFFQRWAVYLIANSILFLGFLQVRDSKLAAIFVASVGFAVSIAIIFDLFSIPGRVAKLEKILDIHDFYERKVIPTKYRQLMMLIILFGVWLCLLLDSLGVISLGITL